MKQFLRVAVLFGVMVAFVALPAVAQKKPVARKETSVQSVSTIKELVSKHVGQKTNLGTIKSVAGDFFVLDDEGVEVIHPLATIHTIKFIKDEEGGETKMEIRLVGMD
jgi:hypothetical protein